MEEATRRVIAHFDVDCFYAQAEILRRPFLEERPVGVTQKFLVVTCNYVARNLGVPKMATIQEAKTRCPDLVLFNGEDLTLYRAASKEIMKVLGQFGTVERCGLDEAAVDITTEVCNRFRRGSFSVKSFCDHVIGLDSNFTQPWEGVTSQASDFSSGDDLLIMGTQLVAEMRAIVKKETGFKCSCGIANNKMLAKLVSSVNKPDKQTCILQSAVFAFLNPLPVRKLPGIGHQTELLLKEIQVETVSDLQKWNACQLCEKFGNRIGTFLYNVCRGIDHTHVVDKGPPKSVSVEDSFRSCTSLKHVEDILRKLAPDLLERLDEDREETGRRPKTFTVKWRLQGSWNFTSVSSHMPVEVLSTTLPFEKRQETMVAAAMKLILHSFANSAFCLAVLNLGATNFIKSQSTDLQASHDIRSLLQNSKSSKYEEKTAGICELTSHGDGLQREDTLFHSALAIDSILENNDLETETRESSKNVHMQYLAGLQGKQLDNTSNYSEESQSILHSDIYAENMKECLLEENAECSRQKPFLDTRNSAAGYGMDLKQFTTVSTEVLTSKGNGFQKFESDSVADSTWEEPWIFCEKCRQRVEGDQKSVQEHGDYHYALELEKQGSDLISSTPKEKISKGKGKLSVRQTSFGRKFQKRTLDTFVSREK